MNVPVSPSDIALVLETNNLASADAPTIERSLQRLLDHLRAQTIGLPALRELVVTHDGLSRQARTRLVAAAGRAVTFVEIDAATDYYEAKNRGFDATTAPFVAFGDADCWPDPEWLERLVEPLSRGAQVAAGRTTYRQDTFGRVLTSIDFLYFRDRTGTVTRNFYANNVAFVRSVFAAHRYQTAPMYRGACQMLGLRLAQAGVAIHYVEAAHTIHRLPDDLRELFELRMRRGRDLRQLAPHIVDAAVPHGRTARPLPAHRRVALAVVAGRWVYSLGPVHRQRSVLPVRALEVAWMTAVTGLDTLGALGRRRTTVEGALSYHANGDRLPAAPADERLTAPRLRPDRSSAASRVPPGADCRSDRARPQA